MLKTWHYSISIHALLAESDSGSRLRSRRARHFYPRSPCGERPKRLSDALKHLHFYPRSPCGERRKNSRKSCSNFYFYPRSPCGERRFFWDCLGTRVSISIHALLAESDRYWPCVFVVGRAISIHALLAESDSRAANCQQRNHHISIHALLAESDFGRAFWPGLSF